jgi:hypothetical protein
VALQDLNGPNVPLEHSRLERLQGLEEATVLRESDMDLCLIDLVRTGVSLPAIEVILETTFQD